LCVLVSLPMRLRAAPGRSALLPLLLLLIIPCVPPTIAASDGAAWRVVAGAGTVRMGCGICCVTVRWFLSSCHGRICILGAQALFPVVAGGTVTPVLASPDNGIAPIPPSVSGVPIQVQAGADVCVRSQLRPLPSPGAVVATASFEDLDPDGTAPLLTPCVVITAWR